MNEQSIQKISNFREPVIGLPNIFYLAIMSLFLFWSSPTMASETAIVIHGGAGTILKERMSRSVEADYRQSLKHSVMAGHRILEAGGTSTEAVIAAITIMEDSPLFNAGHGAVFNNDGEVELDASIMNGDDLNAGAATGIKTVQNPIQLALAILKNSPHVMLMGEGAEAFAKNQGLELVENEYFYTDRRYKQLIKAQSGKNDTALSESQDDEFEPQVFGTVGAVAIDKTGTIVAGTSTGGMTNKRFGRIGDSPIIGAGTYADSRYCGISATGHGEYFIRAAVAHDICAMVNYKNITLKEAANEVIQKKLVAMGGQGGIVGIDSKANISYSFNTSGMYRAAMDKAGNLEIAIFR